MSRSLRLPVALNIVLALGLFLAGASQARADEISKGNCCKADTAGVYFCCALCCTNQNSCISSSNCKQKDE